MRSLLEWLADMAHAARTGSPERTTVWRRTDPMDETTDVETEVEVTGNWRGIVHVHTDELGDLLRQAGYRQAQP